MSYVVDWWGSSPNCSSLSLSTWFTMGLYNSHQWIKSFPHPWIQAGLLIFLGQQRFSWALWFSKNIFSCWQVQYIVIWQICLVSFWSYEVILSVLKTCFTVWPVCSDCVVYVYFWFCLRNYIKTLNFIKKL